MQTRTTQLLTPTEGLIKIDEASGIPLIGLLHIGVIDRGSNLLQVRTSTACNKSCTFCSTDAGPYAKVKKRNIVVDHNPHSIKESEENKIDLQLSGHTHNGQLFPFNYLVNKLYANSKGHKKFGSTHTFVSTGLGTWMIPYRIASKSELIILKLKFLS